MPTDPKPGTGQGDPNPPVDPPADPPPPQPPATGGATGDDGADWKVRAREWERRAKENAAARKELDELKAAQMTEQQKLEARASAAEARAQTLERDNLRYRVAVEKGLPPEMAARLQGDTREDLEADADTLRQLLAPTNGSAPPAGRPDLGQGARGSASPPSADDWVRSMARRR